MRLIHTEHLLEIGVAMTGTAALPSFAAKATLRGASALPGMTEKVTAELVVRVSGTLTRELLIAFTDKATGQPITHFDEELTQELPVLAADGSYTSASSADGVRQLLHASVEIAMRNELHAVAVMPKRWLVERSYA